MGRKSKREKKSSRRRAKQKSMHKKWDEASADLAAKRKVDAKRKLKLAAKALEAAKRKAAAKKASSRARISPIASTAAPATAVQTPAPDTDCVRAPLALRARTATTATICSLHHLLPFHVTKMIAQHVAQIILTEDYSERATRRDCQAEADDELFDELWEEQDYLRNNTIQATGGSKEDWARDAEILAQFEQLKLNAEQRSTSQATDDAEMTKALQQLCSINSNCSRRLA